MCLNQARVNSVHAGFICQQRCRANCSCPTHPCYAEMSAEFKEEFIPRQEDGSQINSGLNPSTSSSNCYSESLQSCSVSFDRLSWHEHVYRRLTNKPTPHYIENILGLQGKSAGQLQQDTTMTGHVTPPDSPQNSFSNVQPATVTSDVNEPLNLSVKNELKVRTKTVKGTLIFVS